jgi:hypothetical protein
MAERCEAYKPAEDAEREAKYVRMYGKNVSLIGKWMLSWFDNPKDLDEKYKEHYAKVTAAAGMQKLVQTLPAHDPNEDAKPMRNTTYLNEKAVLAEKPRYGSSAYILKQYGA